MQPVSFPHGIAFADGTSGVISNESAQINKSKGYLKIKTEGAQNQVDIYADFDSFREAIKNISSQVDENTGNVSQNGDAYNEGSTYAVGDLCIYSGNIYECTSDISSPEAWVSSHWKRVSLMEKISVFVMKRDIPMDIQR